MTPSIDAMNSHSEQLFAVSQNIFKEILRRDADCDTSWKKRLASFDRHGLLSFVLPSPFKPKPIELDESKLDDPVYRRRLQRQLKAPRPGKWTHHKVRVDRALLGDDKYLADMSLLLAHKWAARLDTDCNVDRFLLLKKDIDTVTWCLDNYGPHQTDARSVARAMLRLMVEAMVDKHPLYLEAVDSIRKVGAEEREKLAVACAVIRRDVLDDFDRSTGAHLAEICADADRFIEDMRRRSAESQARSQNVLDEARPDPDPEKSFREAVDRRVREHREANRLGFWPRVALWGAGLGFAVFLAFNMEVGTAGTTPVEFFTDLLGS